jgi:hypothetical protein
VNPFTRRNIGNNAGTGRRWNIDPIVKEFESPYATFSNNPIWFKNAKNDHELKLSLKAAKDAAAKSKANVVVLEVKDLSDLLGQLKKVTKDGAIKVNNMIIDSHGDYDKAQFKIGNTVVKDGESENLRKLGNYKNEESNSNIHNFVEYTDRLIVVKEYVLEDANTKCKIIDSLNCHISKNYYKDGNLVKVEFYKTVKNEKGKVTGHTLIEVDDNPKINPFVHYLPSYLK